MEKRNYACAKYYIIARIYVFYTIIQSSMSFFEQFQFLKVFHVYCPFNIFPLFYIREHYNVHVWQALFNGRRPLLLVSFFSQEGSIHLARVTTKNELQTTT